MTRVPKSMELYQRAAELFAARPIYLGDGRSFTQLTNYRLEKENWAKKMRAVSDGVSVASNFLTAERSQLAPYRTGSYERSPPILMVYNSNTEVQTSGRSL